MRLLLFELKKILFSKRFIYLLFAVMVGVIFLFTRNYFFQSYIEKEQEKEIIEEIQYGQSLIRQYQESLARNPEQPDIQHLQRQIGLIVEILFQMRSTIGSEDWESKLFLEIDYLNKVTEFHTAGGLFPITSTEIKNRIIVNNHLLAKGIKPEHEMYSIVPPNFIKQVVDLLASAGVVVLLLLAIGDLLTSEFENWSLKFLFVQPLKKSSIIHAKVWSSILIYIILLVVTLTTSWTVSKLFGTQGTFDYPILIEEAYGPAFLPLHQYIPALLVLVSINALFVIGLIMVWSIIVKNSLAALFGVIITMIFCYFITSMTQLLPANLNPFYYVLPVESLLSQNDNPWWTAIPVTVGAFGFFYALSIVQMKKVKW